ncbi:MAG TPA: hypothetical protein PLO65_15415 [Caulobacter sp.]|nr:hypothetical protein [Caulobacter sp.]
MIMVLVFRHGVQAEEAGHHPRVAVEIAGRAQHLQLGLEVQAVAGLDLKGRDALGDEGRQPPAGGLDQPGLGRRARGRHGRADTAAGQGDLLVGRAVQPRLVLADAVAAEHQVRVAVDQARRDPAAVQPRHAGRLDLRQITPRADPQDPAVLHGDRRVLDRAIGRAAGRHGRGAAVGDEKVDPLHRPVLPSGPRRE